MTTLALAGLPVLLAACISRVNFVTRVRRPFEGPPIATGHGDGSASLAIPIEEPLSYKRRGTETVPRSFNT